MLPEQSIANTMSIVGFIMGLAATPLATAFFATAEVFDGALAAETFAPGAA
jgi:hypothetical protein